MATLRQADADKSPYQVLILDLHIPDLSGVSILRGVNDSGLKVKTIVLSGESELATVTPILQLGAVDYLRKPFDARQLINSVRNALSRFQLEQENLRMSAEAEENAELYEFLLNASPDLVYMLDAQGCFKFVNHQLENIFDIDLARLNGKTWKSLFEGHPALADKLVHHIDERRTGVRATLAEEFDFTSSVGNKHILELSAIGLYEGRSRDDIGSFLGTYGIVRDITESRRTRRQLQQSQRKFYSLFVDSPDAVFISRLDNGDIIESNPQFVNIRGAIDNAHDTTDRFLWDEVESRQRFVHSLPENTEYQEWMFEKNIQGEKHFFEARARYLELEGERCMIATLRDRTHERRAEQDRLALQQQLQQAGRMEAIGQVAGGIAHDFNNILASIIGYAELVMNARGRLEENQVDQYLDEVVTAGHRAKDLIAQMLNFTRTQGGDTAAIDVTKTITDVSRMLRAAIPSTIELNTTFADDLPAAMVDPIQLQQIIINLLINARDAITGNGRIEMSVYDSQTPATCQTCGEQTTAGSVVVAVKDNGHGIDANILDRIFEMYFTTRASDNGTGFGLWMINNLVHEHGGHITINSTVGKGTEFKIYLSNAHTPAETVNILSVPAPQINGRIVVVDDEVSVANFIGEVLRDRGFPTVVFTESPEAMNYLKKYSDDIALLLTDGAMPLISGLELAEFAKTQNPALPIIFITAFTQSTDTQALERIGVDKYLQKPFSIEEMISAIHEFTTQTSDSTTQPS